MFTSKQRSVLRSMAQTIEPITQIGKGGISENMLTMLSDVLDKRELIKITVLNNSEYTAKEIIEELCEKLGAEPVCVIGHKIVIYRRSKKDIEHIKY